MPQLQLNLLGPSQINLDGNPVTGLSTNKARALLFYLAVTKQTHTRHALATLLWSESSDRKARKNLRNTLFELRKVIEPHFDITAQTLSFNWEHPYHLDVETFVAGLKLPAAQISVVRLNEIVGLYRGDFLEGFHIRNADVFEEWVLMQREHLQKLYLQGLDSLVERCLEQQAYTIGLTATQRLLALESWREKTHRQQMLFLAHTGQRQAALVQYETCRSILAEELDIPPAAETVALYEQLKAGQLSPPPEAGSPTLTVQAVARTTGPAIDNSDPRNKVSSQPSLPQVDWGAAPIQTPFYGRQTELERLSRWLVNDGCRVAAVFGLGGQGKTALALQLAETLARNTLPGGQTIETGTFDRIIWRSMKNAPPFAHLLRDWLETLTGRPVPQIPDHIDAQLALLFEQLRQQRCLLILDDFSRLLQVTGENEQSESDYKAYEQLLTQMTRVDHQSCLLLTGREQPKAFQRLAIDSVRLRPLVLTGLSLEDSRKIFQAFGLNGSHDTTATLHRCYSGNPLALKLASVTVQTVFDGDTDQFVAENTFIFGEIQTLLEQQLAPLSSLEYDILTRLAFEQKPAPLAVLWGYLAHTAPKREFMEALQALQQRYLLEKYGDGFTIQNILAEYLVDDLVETICYELETEAFLKRSRQEGPNGAKPLTTSLLNRHQLIKLQGSRDDQPSHLFQLIITYLTTRWGQDSLKQHLSHLQTVLQTEARQHRGYAQTNLCHILEGISRIGTSDSSDRKLFSGQRPIDSAA